MEAGHQVELIPIYVHYMPKPLEPGKLYISKEFGLAIHLCCCGCGVETVTPLTETREKPGDGWVLTEKEGKVSLQPSIGNFSGENPYHAHYIITDNIATFV